MLKSALLITIATSLFINLSISGFFETSSAAEIENNSNLNLPSTSPTSAEMLQGQISAEASLGEKNIAEAATKRINGNIGESFMDDVFVLEKWEKIPSKIGVQGIDGLYVKRQNGQIRQVLVGESKYGTGTLADTKLSGKQMSHEWIKKKISDLIDKKNKEINQYTKMGGSANDLTRLENELRDLERINKFVSQPSAYRRRLFNTNIKNGELELEFSELDEDVKIVGSPRFRTISLKDPPTGKKNLDLYNKYFEYLKKELKDQGKLGEREAKRAIEELKELFKKGEVSNRAEVNAFLFERIIDQKIRTASNVLSQNYYKCLKLSVIMNNKLPGSLRAPVNAAIVAGLFSTAVNGYKVFQGELSALEAGEVITKDASLAGVSMYVSDGVIQIIEKRIVITALKAGAQIGVATFIFDTTQNVYFLAQGNMTEETFYRETAKSLLKAIGSGTAAYCAVLLGASSGGPVVMAVSIGGYLVVSQGIEYFERLDAKNYVFIEDILGHLPLEMQKRITPFDRGNRTTPWDRPDKITPWDGPNKPTPWEPPNRNTPWE